MKKLIDSFKKLDKKYKIILILVTLFAILIRCIWLNGKSGDYNGFLKPWVDFIRYAGYFKSLKFDVGNYNIPYIVILTLISYLKCEPLYPIKIVSIIFDFVCAIYGAKIVYKLSNKDILLSIISYGVILFLPTVIVNGAMWGQCDSIYTSFTLISLYYLLEKKYIRSFIFLGVSYAFKLQAVFILPLYVLLLFRDKNVKFWHFLIIILVNFILCLPAIIMGRNIVEVMMIYFNQTEYYDTLVLNFPNFYNFFIKDIDFYSKYYQIITKIGLLFTMFLYFCIWLYTLLKKVKFNSEKVITVGIWSIMIATFFLPRMHERYMFVIDILSVIWFLIYQKKFFIPVTINLVSFISYLYYLFGYDFIDYRILSVLYFIVIFIFTICVLKMLGEDNEDKKGLKEYKIRKNLKKLEKCKNI